MGLDPSSPEMTFLLVMLHTGTMFAVIVYFWNAWREHYFSSVAGFRSVVINVVIATIITGIVGLALQLLIEKVFLKGEEKNRRGDDVNASRACWIGAVQGLCLPFRGFSRSGATISTGLLLGIGKRRMEAFSFALAVVITPPVIAREFLRLIKAHPE